MLRLTATLAARSLALIGALLAFITAQAVAQPVWQSAQTNTGNSSTASANKPTNLAAGDLMVVSLTRSATNIVVAPDGWTVIRQNTGTNISLTTLYKVATSADVSASTFAFTLPSSTTWAIAISRLTGANPNAPIHISNGQAGTASSSVVTAPSVTPTIANTLGLAFYTNERPATFNNYSTGQTERYDAPNSNDSTPRGPSNAMATFNGPAANTVTGNKTAEVSSGSSAPYAAQLVMVAAPVAQTISFTAPATKTFRDPDFTVSATATSGLTVSFSIVSGPATVSGNTVTLTGAGSVTIRASQAGDNTYSAAPNVDRTFDVNKANQTISFDALANKTFGDDAFTVSATATSGLSPSFSIVSGPATISGSTVTISGAGTVTVRASQAGNADYNAATNVDQSFTVAKDNQTITFGSLPDKTFGDAAFTVSATASSGLAPSYSIVSGPATISGSTVTISGAGTVTVRASQAGSVNYNAATDVDQTFTVAKGNQTITFGSLVNKTFGDAAFTVSATASSGLSPSFSIVSGPATIIGTTVTITGVGTVTVRASQAGNTNFNTATDVDQSFTVAKADQTITFGALADKTVGDATFTVSATSTSGLSPTFSVVSGPATISGAIVTLTGEGSVTIRASQAGDADYNAATDVDRTFAVNKTAQTITFGSLANKTFGEVPFPVSATASSGLTPTFTILSGPATISDSTVTITGAGSVTVRASQAGNATYSAAPNVDQTFTVNKADQTITFASLANKTFGEAAVSVSATASSGLSPSFSIVSGPATISGSAVTITGAGSVTVRASQSGNTDYNAAADVDRTFTVNKADQTITFASLANKTFGDANFTVSATASSGLSPSFTIVSGPASITGSTVTITGAGSVTVRAGQSGNTDYNAASNVDRTFTVSKANQTITFASLANKTFGDAPFSVTATTDSGLSPTLSIVSGPATIIGSTVTITASGEVTVRASQSGNTDYNAAANVDRTFTIARGAFTAPASQSVTEDVVTAISGISFTDLDAGTVTITATFNVASGTLNATSGGGVTVTGNATDTVSLFGTIANVTSFLDAHNLTFTTASNRTTTETLQTTVFVSVTQVASGSTTLTVTAVNDVPVNSLPAAQSVVINTSRTLSTANANRISIADVDAGNNEVEVTLTASNGTLTLSGITGLTFTTGDGNSDTTMTFRGLITAINTALDGLIFTPTASYLGAASIQIVTDDLGNTGTGGPLTATDTLTFTVLPSDTIAPAVASILRASSSPTDSPSVTYTVTFTEDVLGVDVSDFVLSGNGTIGNVTGVTTVNPSVYTVTITGISGNGVLRLDLLPTGTNIVDLASNPIVTGYTAGEVYEIDQSSPDLAVNLTVMGTYGTSFNLSSLSDLMSSTPIRADGLPRGLSISGAGVISGVPTQTGSFEVSTFDANGNILSLNLAITIDKAPLTVAANNQSRAFGAANPTFTVNYVGLLNGDTPVTAGITGFAALTTTATATTPVGTAPINVALGSLASNNYLFDAFVSGTLTITKIPQAITLTASSGIPITLSAVASSGLPVNIAVVSGDATLAGNVLSVTSGTSVTVRASQSGNGTYTAAPDVLQTFTITLPVVRDERLVNLSSRVRVAPGRSLVSGFVISGTEPKRILLRAVGPTLSVFGVTAPVANPRFDLYDSTGQLIIGNDDWTGADTSAASSLAGAFALPVGSRDAALVTTLSPGAYTIHVSGGNDTGVVVAEIYDASAKPLEEKQRLVNVSSRGTLDATESILFGGFVIAGDKPKRVLIRGIGPALIPFGVTGAVADPRLAIYSGQTLLAQNDDWGTPTTINNAYPAAPATELSAAAAATGAFAFTNGAKDAAILVTLPPGAYTAQVTGSDNTTGEAMVEIYELP